ncbi:MAG: class I SAM-dependent methyltransferase [Pseudorhodoplanes sp.]|uniref:class I SAM-dependent methyltransferase n=1 Tax=Pseudorhodoplanes sp. TaxID=1934341 RepID=UPI003D09791B
MGDWISFFDSDHAIYVNARHKQVHAIITGNGMAEHIRPGDRVLDYGCGEAAYAERLAGKTATLTLCEAAPSLRQRLKARVAPEHAISVLAPEEVAALPDGAFEVVIMHSVSQYLSPDELVRLLGMFRRLLTPDGTLVIGDVVQPDIPAWKDALALLRFGWREGFFAAAVGGLFRTAFSGYAKLRKDAGLTRYGEHEMAARLDGAGFRSTRAPRNIGHLQTRMTFVAHPA